MGKGGAVWMVVLVSVLVGVAGWSACAADKPLIVYSLCWAEDPYWLAASEAAGIEARALGYDFEVLNAGNDITTQNDQLDDIIAKNPAGVIIAAVDKDAVLASVAAVQAEGIPVAVHTRTLDGARDIVYTVKPDIVNIGRMAAIHAIGEIVKRTGSYEGKVLHVMGELGDSYTVEVSQGVNEILANYPGIELVEKEADGWSFVTAGEIVEDHLSAFPDTDVIISCSDWLTQAYPSVLEGMGYTAENRPAIVSTGGMSFGLDLIRDGWQDCTISQSVLTMGKMIAWGLDQVIKGNAIPNQVYRAMGGMDPGLTDTLVDVIQEPWGPTVEIAPFPVMLYNSPPCSAQH